MAIIGISSMPAPEQQFGAFLNSITPLFLRMASFLGSFIHTCDHLIEYAILAVLMYRASRYFWKDQSEIFVVLLTCVGVILFGCTDELCQLLTPPPSFNVWELTADAIGRIRG